MKNAVGREIPDYLLTEGREVYQGKNYMDGKYIQKASPRTRRYEKPQESKLVDSLAQALRQCGARSGMTFSFHHHLRDGDYVVNLVMAAAIEELGLKDLTIAATSLGSAHDPIAGYIEQGKVVGIQTSGIRGRIGEVVSAGKLKTPAVIRSHGGRPRAIEAGEVHIDIAFVAAPTSDCVGNCRGVGGKSDCGSLGYAMTDAKYADHVVVVTDCLVDFPNFPASVEAIDVDAVVVVDSIGNPKKIASAAARISQNPRDLMMAENVAKVIASTPYFKDGFSFQTGVGGPSLAANLFLEQYMDERNIKMGWAIGGICGPMVELLKKGKVGKVIDVQDFDLDAVNSIHQTPNHFEMSASQYANPANKGAFVNKLDFVVLAALEVDTDFNVNVLTGSDGVLRGAPGGHPDTAAGSKCCIIVTPLTRGRMATVCEHVVTVTTPGDCVDVLVTDYGIAVNPLRPDLIACLDQAGIPHVPIETLKEKAYSLVGRPEDLQWEDQVVAVLEAPDCILEVPPCPTPCLRSIRTTTTVWPKSATCWSRRASAGTGTWTIPAASLTMTGSWPPLGAASAIPSAVWPSPAATGGRGCSIRSSATWWRCSWPGAAPTCSSIPSRTAPNTCPTWAFMRSSACPAPWCSWRTGGAALTGTAHPCPQSPRRGSPPPAW